MKNNNFIKDMENILETIEMDKNMERKDINTILNETRKLAKLATQSNQKIYYPMELKEKVQEINIKLQNAQPDIPLLRDIFLKDREFLGGDMMKCVVNALKEKKYKKRLNMLKEEIHAKKHYCFKNLVTYHVLWDLSAERFEIINIFNVYSSATQAIISNLEKNNIVNLENLIMHMLILLNRLYSIHCIYGYYLKDINWPLVYKVQEGIFEKLFSIYTELLSIVAE